MTGRRDEAAELVCRVADACADKPLDTLPRVGRMLAKLHAAQDDRAAAAEWFERAARVLASAADECARSEVLEDYARFLRPSFGVPDAAPSGRVSQLPGLRPAPSRVTVHSHAATSLAPAASAPTVSSTLERATTLLDLAGRPVCLGQELQALLGAAAAISQAAIVSKGEHGADVLAFWGDYSRIDTLLADGPVDRFPLGRWREHDVELRVQPRTDLASRSAIVAARKIVEASLQLDAARREQRERAALWPLDEPIEARFGVFASQAMTELVATARKIAPSDTNVLITGETGTGKEVLARIIHETSRRAGHPFIPFNCAAVPRDMLDSQLFGYRRGAFTGATAHFPGVIRSAAGGTLLLDEVGEITLELQPKLLRFLEAQEVQPLGDAHPVAVDVRVLAATNADLDQLLASGRFREDLYYRLNVIRLRVPPLRERREEIPVLVQHFLKRFAEENRKDNIRIAEETMEYLLLYSWPGNVRELLNQMRRLAALAENGAVLMPEHLSPEIVASRRTVPASERSLAPTEVVVRLDQPLAAAIEHIERAMVPWAMRTAGGRTELAARMLGLSRKGLYLKRQRLGLDAGGLPAGDDEETNR
jgi:DNA-binding NtrC family response regulator